MGRHSTAANKADHGPLILKNVAQITRRIDELANELAQLQAHRRTLIEWGLSEGVPQVELARAASLTKGRISQIASATTTPPEREAVKEANRSARCS